MWRRRAVAALLATAVVSSGCTARPDRSEQPDPSSHRTSVPGDELTLLDGDAEERALGVSRALYDRAPVVVLAGADEPDRYEPAAGTAVELGAPLLLTPGDGSTAGDPDGDPDGDRLRDELDRLGVETVITAGDAAGGWAERLADRLTVMAGAPANGTPAPDLPETAPAEPLPSGGGRPPGAAAGGGDAAASATARAAGARVVATGASDPRADPELIAEVAGESTTHVIALGGAFGPADRLADRLAVARTGVELPGGGQVLFPGRTLVALYGHPGDGRLGALGEQSLDATIDRAEEVAGEYASLVDEPVVPTLEIITTVASAGAGPEGDYSRRTPPDELRPWLEAAAEAGVYVVLDLQPGHTDFLTQAKEYEELLREPHVGLALDPEWRLAPDQRHMVQIGSVDAAEVNEVTAWLAGLTAQHQLPQKLLVLHQFRLSMITDRDELETGRDEVAVMVHADGFGTRGQKFNTWNTLRADAPDVWWGWKNFYDEDRPTFTPAETVDIEPRPRFVSYQ